MIVSIHDQLSAVFSPAHFGNIGNVVDICESEVHATVRTANFNTSGKMFVINNCFQKNLQGLHNHTGQCTPLACDCDGVLVVELEGKVYVVFIELKSSYKVSQIVKAQKQLFAGFFHILSHLHCITSFNGNACKYCSVIVSHPITDEEQRLYMQWKQQGQIDQFHQRALFFATHRNSSVILRKSDVAELDTLPICQGFLCNEMPLFHCDVPENNSTVAIDIDALLATL